MTPDLDERTDPPALATLTGLARRGVQPASTETLRRGWSTVAARLSTRKARKRSLVRLSMAGAAASALVLVVFGVVSLSRTRMPTAAAALAYQIQGGSVVDGGYLRESGSGTVKLLFAEGTEFVLMPGARGRLRAVDSNGARIAIEQGTASFQVTPRREAKWFVDVGPFLVTVKGTVFTVSWDADRERFELRLQHGQVSVAGPIAGGAIPLTAGQRLVIDLPKGETLISEQPPEEAWQEAWPAAPAEGPIPSKADNATNTAADDRPALGRAGQGSLGSPSVAGKTSGRRAWSEALASGDWDRILADVDRMGVKRTLAEASSEDLFAVADAARYRRRTALAREALQTERRRFPDSARALDAVFMLGRLEESKERGTHKAITLYEEYLTRAPNGTYASEALGRRMMATRRLEGAARAKGSAEEYLRRFPSGTYAGAARALLRAP